MRPRLKSLPRLRDEGLAKVFPPANATSSGFPAGAIRWRCCISSRILVTGGSLFVISIINYVVARAKPTRDSSNVWPQSFTVSSRLIEPMCRPGPRGETIGGNRGRMARYEFFRQSRAGRRRVPHSFSGPSCGRPGRDFPDQFVSRRWTGWIRRNSGDRFAASIRGELQNVRPLLGVWREEIDAFVQGIELSFAKMLRTRVSDLFVIACDGG